MHHQSLENELKHLEMVLAHAGNGPFPHAYWKERLAALPVADAAPAYHSRVARLRIVLAGMEKPGAE